MRILAALLVMFGTTIMILSVMATPIGVADVHPAIIIIAGWTGVGMIGVGCAMLTAEDDNG